MRKFLLSGAAAFALTASPSILLAQNTAAGEAMQPPADSTSPMPTPAPTPPGTTATPPGAGGATTSTSTSTNFGQSAGSASSAAGGQASTMSAQQRSVYSSWPAERRSGFDALPPEQQTYYWTLRPEEQEGFWALTPDQRGRLYNMSPEQRALAWQSIVQQLQGQAPTTPPGQANPPGPGVPTAGVPNPQDANQAARPAMPADESYEGGPYKGALTPPPAPAMNKDYPVCSKTVQDSCRNPGSK